MKKLLSILSSVGLVAIASTNVVSCSKTFDGIEASDDTIMDTSTIKTDLDFKQNDSLEIGTNEDDGLPYKIIREDDSTYRNIVRFYVDPSYLDGTTMKSDSKQVETFITFSVSKDKFEYPKTITYDLISKDKTVIKKIKVKIMPTGVQDRMIANAYSKNDVEVELDDWTQELDKYKNETIYFAIVDKDDDNFSNSNSDLNYSLSDGGNILKPQLYGSLIKDHNYKFKMYHYVTTSNSGSSEQFKKDIWSKPINILY